MSFGCICLTAKTVWSTFLASYNAVFPNAQVAAAAKALAAAKGASSFIVLDEGYLATLQSVGFANLSGSPAEAFENILNPLSSYFGRVSEDWSAKDSATAPSDFFALSTVENALDSDCAGPDVIKLLSPG